MMPRVWRDCSVELISAPIFLQPQSLRVRGESTATYGENLIEFSGRVCYMSQHNPADRTTQEYIENILQQKHGSVIEHANYSVFIQGVSRTLTHELVRHRAGWAYSQLSQRYVGQEHIGFVVPPLALSDPELMAQYEEMFLASLINYRRVMDILMADKERFGNLKGTDARKASRQVARAVLPGATETKLVATANLRAWRHFFEMRGSIHAEPEIRRLAVACLRLLRREAPAVLHDLEICEADDPAYPFRISVLHSKV